MTAHLLRRLRRNQRGSVMIELGAGVFLLMIFAIGLAQFATLTIDVDRDSRAVRSGVDLLWQIDEEVSVPTQDEIDALGTAMAELSKLDADDRFRVHFSVFDADSSGQASIVWSATTGNRGEFPATRAVVDGANVSIDGDVFTVEDDEKLLVVEVMRNGFGLRTQGGDSYRAGMTYKTDGNIGP